MRTLLMLGPLLLSACGSAPPQPCALPTAQEERAAFLERFESMRARHAPTLEAEAANFLATPSAPLRVRITERGLGLIEGDHTSWSRAELEAQLERADPTRLEWLLDRDDMDILAPLDAGGRVPASARMGAAQGFLIPALLSALEAHTRSGAPPAVLGLEIWPDTPFRTVAEVVYTAGQAGIERLEFLLRVGSEERAHPIGLPALDAVGPASPRDEPRAPRLGLSLTLTARGAAIRGAGDLLAPGCEAAGEASDEITLPAESAAVDPGAIRACLVRIKAAFPHEDTIVVSAEPGVAFEHVARAAVAAAGIEGELFPVTFLSAGVR